ncbi:MAG: alpha/beta hydrolase [candidate division Zixibacteria bacterium]
MKRLNSNLKFFVIALMLFSFGCAKEAEKVILSPDGVEISLDQRGEGEPTVIFIHGWANNKGIWDAQMSYFAEKHRVIAVDLPGYGESGYNRTDWTMASFAQDVNTVIDKLNLEKVVLVGFSMGGPVIVESAKSASENLIGLVIVDALKDVEMKYSPEMIISIDSVFTNIVTYPTGEKLLAGGFYKQNPDASYVRVVTMLSGQKNTSRIGWRESFNDIFRWLNEDCIDALQKVSVPIVSICSDMEPINEEAFKKYVPSYKLKIIPETGHLVMWDNPEEFNRLLEESIQEIMGKSR